MFSPCLAVEEDGLACKSGAHSEIVTSESQELRHNVNTYVGDIIDDAIDTVKADSGELCKLKFRMENTWQVSYGRNIITGLLSNTHVR